MVLCVSVPRVAAAAEDTVEAVVLSVTTEGSEGVVVPVLEVVTSGGCLAVVDVAAVVTLVAVTGSAGRVLTLVGPSAGRVGAGGVGGLVLVVVLVEGRNKM